MYVVTVWNSNLFVEGSVKQQTALFLVTCVNTHFASEGAEARENSNNAGGIQTKDITNEYSCLATIQQVF